MPASISSEFKKKADEVHNLKEEPSQGDQLQAKAKYDAWQKTHEEGISSEQAQKRYIALADKLIKEIGFKA
ncbi:hypothetical protein MMC24_003332 [Lignoscripta atroalba]|nr:hypothetical protein [Lignoscripta atroalba]